MKTVMTLCLELPPYVTCSARVRALAVTAAQCMHICHICTVCLNAMWSYWLPSRSRLDSRNLYHTPAEPCSMTTLPMGLDTGLHTEQLAAHGCIVVGQLATSTPHRGCRKYQRVKHFGLCRPHAPGPRVITAAFHTHFTVPALPNTRTGPPEQRHASVCMRSRLAAGW